MGEKQNFIKATWAEDEKAIVLQMHIGDEPGTWIIYNLEQLDDLIELLRKGRVLLAEKLGVQ